MKYWEIIADNLSKAGWSLGWRFEQWIVKGQQAGLLTPIAVTGSASLSVRMEKLAAFLELEAEF